MANKPFDGAQPNPEDHRLDGQCLLLMSALWRAATTTTLGMAMDGIHPSATGYAVWAEGLSPHILASVAGLPDR